MNLATEAEDVSAQLRALYRRYWPGLRAVRKRWQLSPPLLIDPSTEYWEQKIKLMVVGQETALWYDDEVADREKEGWSDQDIITLLMSIYKDPIRFALATGTEGKKVAGTPFWQAVRQLEAGLGIAPGACVWSNVNRCAQNARGPCEKAAQELAAAFPLLIEEITLCRPDVVVLFIGPHYEKPLRANLPNLLESRRPSAREPLVEMHGVRPQVLWTYHPRYLRQGRLSDVLSRLVQLGIESRAMPP